MGTAEMKVRKTFEQRYKTNINDTRQSSGSARITVYLLCFGEEGGKGAVVHLWCGALVINYHTHRRICTDHFLDSCMPNKTHSEVEEKLAKRVFDVRHRRQ